MRRKCRRGSCFSFEIKLKILSVRGKEDKMRRGGGGGGGLKFGGGGCC